MNFRYAIVDYHIFDRTGIEAYLERMALKGWMLEKINMVWKFRKIEPQKLHFTVVYYPRGSYYNDGPTNEQILFQDMCEEAGWKMAVCHTEMMVFYSEDENPVLIETDPVVQVESIHKSMEQGLFKNTKRYIWAMLLYLALLVYMVWDFPLKALANEGVFNISITIILGIFIQCIDVFAYLHWHKKAEKAAREQGMFLPTKTRRFFLIFAVLALLAVLIWYAMSLSSWQEAVVYFGRLAVWFVFSVILIRVVKSIKTKQGQENPKRWKAFAVAFVITFAFTQLLDAIQAEIEQSGFIPDLNPPFDTVTVDEWTYSIYKDEIPLKLEDFMEGNFEQYSYELEIEESPLMKRTVGTQTDYTDVNDERPWITYWLYEIKTPLLIDFSQKLMIKEAERLWTLTEHSPYMWSADKVYKMEMPSTKSYLVFWENRMMRIMYEFEPTEDQIKIMVDKLKNY